MSMLTRRAGLAVMAGLIGLSGCSTTPAGSTGAAKPPAPASSTPTPRTTAPSPSPTGKPTDKPTDMPRACTVPGTYLTDVRVGAHNGHDRVVFEFSGGLPAVTADRVPTVYADPKGTPVALAGQSNLRVVFREASGVCGQPLHRTWTGPSVLTPYYPELLVVSAAGDFEGYLSFGIGLAARGSCYVSTLASPDRVVIDFSHVTLAKFPGIWDITSWPQYWARQYWWRNGHQPWLASPLMVVRAWARSRWHTTPVIHEVDSSTFKVTEPGGRLDTLRGVRPVGVPGPWVITQITYGTSRPAAR
jgi:hypothetical protein